MKKFVVVLFALLFSASLAEAAEHVVVRGETLWGLAGKHKTTVEKLAAYNGIADINKLEIGQKLVIPDGVTKAEAGPIAEVKPVEKAAKKATEKLAVVKTATTGGIAETDLARQKTATGQVRRFYLNRPGANRFGNRAVSLALKQFNVPQVVRDQWSAGIEKRGNQKKYENRIVKGDRFEQMAMGGGKKGRIVNNVVANWKDPNLALAAEEYMAVYDGQLWVLTEPLICTNWAWNKEPAPVIEKQEQPVVTPVIAATPAAKPEEKKKKVRVEAFVGAGSMHGTTKSNGANNFWTYGTAEVLPLEAELEGGGKIYAGIAATGVLFQGNQRDYRWNGSEWVVGPAAIIDFDKKGNRTLWLKAGIGQMVNDGSDTKGYNNHQTNLIGSASAYYTDKTRLDAGETLLPKFGLGVDGTLALGKGHRDNSWRGQPVGSRPENINSIGVRYQQAVVAIPTSNKPVSKDSVLLGARVGAGVEGDFGYIEAGPFAELVTNGYEVATVGVGVKYKNGGWSVGPYVDIDVGASFRAGLEVSEATAEETRI